MGIIIDDSKPIYSINVAAELSGISVRTLREYEKAGFIKPERVSGKRRYSNNDLEFIKNVRFYLEEVGMTIPALKVLYMTVPCWEIKQCEMYDCPAYGNFRERCWEIIARHGMFKKRACRGCPVFLTYQKNKGMKIHQGKDVGPRCFVRE